jgi:hypothetical protein
MTDAAHNQHSETRRPSDRDRIVTTGPSRFQPVQKCCAEMMSVSVSVPGQPTHYQLAVNLKTAPALGLTQSAFHYFPP